MALVTRKPTGATPWPMILLAGVEKAGKSWACAEASSSPLVGRSFWIGIGEDDPDEYANIAGADFEIVAHEGTYRSILNTIAAATAEPGVDGKPNLIIVDSMTRLWDLIKTDMEEILIARLKKARKPIPDDLKLSMDLWNLAGQRWDHIMDTLRAHKGPVLLTSRLNYVTLMDEKGQPTKQKDWKVDSQKSLPFDVTGIVQLRARGDVWITGLKSVRFTVPGMEPYNGFSVQDLWAKLGVGESVMADRSHANLRAVADDSKPSAPAQQAQPAQPAPQGVPEDWWFVMLSEFSNVEGLRDFYNRTKSAPNTQGVPADWANLINARATDLQAAAA